MILYPALSSGIDFPREAAACGAVRIVHNRDRRLVEDSVQVHEVVQNRVGETGEEEDDHYTGVSENLSQFMREYSPEVLKPHPCITIFLHIDLYFLGKFCKMYALLSLHKANAGSNTKMSKCMTSLYQPAKPVPKITSLE